MKIIITANTCWNLINFRKTLISNILKKNKVIVIANTDKFSRDLKKMGCQVYDLSIESRSTSIFKEINLLIRYYKLINKLKPHIVLSFTIKPNIYSSICCNILKIKNICNITGLGVGFQSSNYLRFLLTFLFKISIKNCNKIFFQNYDDLKYFKRNKIINKDYELIPGSGIRIKKIKKKYKKKNNNSNFLYVGRIIRDKGIIELIKAFLKLVKNNNKISLTLVGGQKGDLSKQILNNKNKFIKIIKFSNNIQKYYLKADYFIFPSHREGMSNALLQAGLYKLPVICSNVPGNRDLIKDNVNGFLFKPKSSDSIYNSMKRVMRTRTTKLNNMKLKLYNKIKYEYNDQKVIKKYLNAIDQLKN